jgi:tape measure domain-containing protein
MSRILQKFAANTPFEFQGLVDSSRLLLGVGTSQKVIPMLTDFGDAAGALGIQQDAFQRIMLATSQAISAGKFQVGDINQMVQNGIPVWSLLSKSLGKPVTELRKMASHREAHRGRCPAQPCSKQMHKDYGGSMAKQSQTLAGLWSTFTDTLSQGLAQALMPLVPV